MELKQNSTTKRQPLQKLLGTIQVIGGEVFLLGQKEPGTEQQMLSFAAGLGDGVYEVFGKYINVPDYGYKLASIMVEFFSEEEVKWMERQKTEYPSIPH